MNQKIICDRPDIRVSAEVSSIFKAISYAIKAYKEKNDIDPNVLLLPKKTIDILRKHYEEIMKKEVKLRFLWGFQVIPTLDTDIVAFKRVSHDK